MYEITVHGQPKCDDYENEIDKTTASSYLQARDKLIALYKKHGSTCQYRFRCITGLDIEPAITHVVGPVTGGSYADTEDRYVNLDKAFEHLVRDGLLRRQMKDELKAQIKEMGFGI